MYIYVPYYHKYYNVVSIVTQLQARWRGDWILVEARDFFLHQNVQADNWSPLTSYAMGTWILSHGESGQCVKLATSVKVKNEGNCISAFLVYIYGMDRNIFTLFIYFCYFIFII